MKMKSWSVLIQDEGVLSERYCGPDKTKARDVAAKLLHETKKPVLVVKPGRLTVLTHDDLKQQLPKDVF